MGARAPNPSRLRGWNNRTTRTERIQASQARIDQLRSGRGASYYPGNEVPRAMTGDLINLANPKLGQSTLVPVFSSGKQNSFVNGVLSQRQSSQISQSLSESFGKPNQSFKQLIRDVSKSSSSSDEVYSPLSRSQQKMFDQYSKRSDSLTSDDSQKFYERYMQNVFDS
ncbi:MAG: hypothetical protein WCN97_11370 [Thermoleophilia bacterium]